MEAFAGYMRAGFLDPSNLAAEMDHVMKNTRRK